MSRHPEIEIRIKLPLEHFELEIHHRSSRQVTGLFGPSGSGKTSCLESIAGLRRGVEGLIACGETIWLDSEHQVNLPPEKRGIGYVPQDHLLFPNLDVTGNLKAGKPRAQQSEAAWQHTCDEVVRVLELENLLKRKIDRLSGGERQRVALARALCSGPRMLLLDEPLASLDVKLRHRILPYLLRIREAFDIPIIIVSHSAIELLALCDEIVAIDRGKVIAAGNPVDVLTQSEVYGRATGEQFENILPVTVDAIGAHTARLLLGTGHGNPSVSVIRPVPDIGSQIRIGIPAADILIATQPPQGLSARNLLPATIQKIRQIGFKTIISTQLDSSDTPPLIVEITNDALESLNLSLEQEIWLVIKTSSIVVYG